MSTAFMKISDYSEIYDQVQQTKKDAVLYPLISYLFDAMNACDTKKKVSKICLALGIFVGMSRAHDCYDDARSRQNFIGKYDDDIKNAIRAINEGAISLDDLVSYNEFPNNPFKIFEVKPKKHHDNVIMFVRNNDASEKESLKELKHHAHRLFYRKVNYFFRCKLKASQTGSRNITQAGNHNIIIDMDDFMSGCGDTPESLGKDAYKVKKSRAKRDVKKNLKIIDKKGIICNIPQGIMIAVSIDYLNRYYASEKTKPQCYVPWLLRLSSELHFVIAEMFIAQYTNQNNRQKKVPNYNCLTYRTIFLNWCTASKRSGRIARYDGSKEIVRTIKTFHDMGYIKSTWYKESISLKNARPDTHDEALKCRIKFSISVLDRFYAAKKSLVPNNDGHT